MSSKIKKIAQKGFEIYFSIPFRIISQIHKKLPQEMMSAICRSYEKQETHYTTLRCRPKTGNQVIVLPKDISVIHQDFAIVLQGPPAFDDDFTYESILLYKKIFPGVKIILSTWRNIDNSYIEKVKKVDCYVVLNDLPQKTGRGNVNYQVKSSRTGILKAKELGCRYVIKSRTDQRIYNSSLCNFIEALLTKFPSNIPNQKKRIVILQGSTGCMFLPYYIADFFYAGSVEDMLKLFDEYEEDKYNFKNRDEIDRYDLQCYENNPLGKALHCCAPQNIIMEKYASEIGYIPDYTVKQYWDFVRDGLIGITVEQIGLFWRKYTSNIFENSWSHSYEFGDSSDQLLTYNWTFDNWLSLYMNVITYKPEYEKYQLRYKK